MLAYRITFHFNTNTYKPIKKLYKKIRPYKVTLTIYNIDPHSHQAQAKQMITW